METVRANLERHAQVTDAQPSEPCLLTVFLREYDRLRRIAAGSGMAGSDIDDVLQDVSIQVLKHSGKFEQENEVMRWLIRITINRCLSEHRRRFRRRIPRILRRRPELQMALTAGTPDTADQAAMIEELEIIRRAMADMDPSLLKMLVLRYFSDLDSTRIGEMLGLNASTVRGRLREARMILAGKLVRRGIEP